MTKREKCRSGLEQDVIHAKRCYYYTQKPGLAKWVKRRINKRERRKGNVEIIELLADKFTAIKQNNCQ